MLEAEAPLQQLVVEGIETFVVDIIDLGIETIAGMFGERKSRFRKQNKPRLSISGSSLC